MPHAHISIKRFTRLATSVNAVSSALNAIQRQALDLTQAPEEVSLKYFATDFLCDIPAASHDIHPLTANVERLASSGPRLRRPPRSFHNASSRLILCSHYGFFKMEQ